MRRLVARVCGVVPESADRSLGPFLPPIVQCNVRDDAPVEVGDVVEIKVRAIVTAVVPGRPLPQALVIPCS